jgi:transcriptional regulator with XRE-family HTH domain
MRLKELRKANKLKQTDIAEFLSCSQGVYSRYESEEREPPFDIIKKLAEYYGVTIDYLMGGEEAKNQPTPTPVQAQEKAPGSLDDQIMQELEGFNTDQLREVLNFIRFRKQGGK